MAGYQSKLQEHVIQILSQRWPAFHCPVCRSSNWGVQGGMYNFPEVMIIGVGSIATGQSLACAALVCQVCGYTQFMNLRVLDPNWDWTQ